MQVERRSGNTERRILISMIVDASVLGRIAVKWDKAGLFDSRWSNIVGGWCVAYHRQYGKAPAKAVVGLFESWAADNQDTETVDLIERFLEGLSSEWEAVATEVNPDYMVDTAGEYFNKVRLRKLRDALEGDLDAGDLKKAQKRVDKFSRLELGAAARIDVLEDSAAIRRAFEEEDEPPLIKYPGAAGNFLGPALKRGKFVAIMAPTKTGKTQLLTDISWRGMQQNRKVAFFAIGDESEDEMMARYMTRAIRRPLTPTSKEEPVRYPTMIDRASGSVGAEVVFEERHYEDKVSWKAAVKACKKVLNRRKGERLLALACFPSLGVSVDGLEDTLQSWERDGWGSPDVIVIDYADNLAPLSGYLETRDAINATWQKLRGISQSRRALVVTATQSDARSYDAKTLGKSHFSNDRRKLDHVTGMIGLNQTTDEKRDNLMRWNWIVLRKGKFLTDACCYVAGCPEIANPCVRSIF